MNKVRKDVLIITACAALLLWMIRPQTSHAQQPMNSLQLGGSALYVDPCLVNTPSYGTFSGTASAKIISGTSGKKTYFCGWNDQNGGTATNYAIVEGTGTTCGTSTAAFPGMSGGTTAAGGWNTGANGGRVLFLSGYTVAQAATAADDTCILLSASNQVNAGFKYVQQ